MPKAEGTGLPKSVAGFKIPKTLRRARLLDGLLDTQEGRELVADALVSAAEAVANVIRNHKPVDPPADESGHDAD